MLLYFDLALGKLVELAGYAAPLGGLVFKRGDDARLEVSFCRGTAAATLDGTPSEMVFVVKKSVGALEPVLMLADDWTFDAVAGVWSALLPSDAQALTTLLGTTAFVDLLGEFTFTDDSGGPVTSQTLKVRVHNDLWKGTEGTPLSLQSPEEWLEARRPQPLERTTAPVSYQPYTLQIGEDDPVTHTSVAVIFASDVAGVRISYRDEEFRDTVGVVVVGHDVAISRAAFGLMYTYGATSGVDETAIIHMPWVGILNGKSAYSNTGEVFESAATSPDGMYTHYDGSKWCLINVQDGAVFADADGGGAGTHPSDGTWADDTVATGRNTASQVCAAIAGFPAAAGFLSASVLGDDLQNLGMDLCGDLTGLTGMVAGTPGVVGQRCYVNSEDIYECVRETLPKWVKLT
jgi:hypothetical protein